MKRCPHGVYSPDGDGLPSYACSGCFVPDANPIPAPRVQFNPFPGGEKKCPRCGERRRFNYTDEWNYHCGACDLDALGPDD